MADLVGYSLCNCGTLIRDEIAWLTDGRCLQCHRTHLNRIVAPIEISVRGQRMTVERQDCSPAERARRQRRNAVKAAKRKADSDYRRRKHQSEHAKRRALRRLKLLFPDVYDLLLAEEREKMNLPAFTPHRATASAAASAAYETLERLGIYHPEP